MVADLIHEGHINILEYASELGKVMVGLLTDDCVEGYKRRPIQSWENRKTVVSAISYVDSVVPQPTLSYKIIYYNTNHTMLFMVMTGVKVRNNQQEMK